ncbi:MAG: S46 family peptidase, partial [Proteiniphilum sp.]|nr:S46 family peptidase [Proteiniphilum sp.]
MKKLLFYLSFWCLFFFTVSADEGMWMLHSLKQQKLNDMKELGLKLEDYDIYNPDGSSIKD